MKFYRFGFAEPPGDPVGSVKLLGGKGQALAEMSDLGFPVPPGFTIPASACNKYREMVPMAQKEYVDHIVEGIMNTEIPALKKEMGYIPLLSVRSGARVSMPGMMDTVLNLGLANDPILSVWRERIGDWATMDSFRRLLQMYANVVLEAPSEVFERRLTSIKAKWKKEHEQELPSVALIELCEQYLDIYVAAGEHFPTTLDGQLSGSIEAVFKSWDNDRAKHYRKMHGIPDDWGTAVNIQAMVFGNMNEQSCSGVVFTRDPNTGEIGLVGEYLPNAQGEDVVAGIRTPYQFLDMNKWDPLVYEEIRTLVLALEAQYHDMQDVEFTVQDGQVFLLQTRSGKRSARAAFRIAWDMYSEDSISLEEALSRLSSKDLMALNTSKVQKEYLDKAIATGIPAAGNVVTGTVALSSDEAVARAKDGPVILVAKETTPEDLKGIEAAVGILTFTGGKTSHAAVVARGMNKTCVVGCTSCPSLSSGDTISIDGSLGLVWTGIVPVEEKEEEEYAAKILKEAYKNSGVTPRNAKIDGIGKVYLDAVQFSGFDSMVKAVKVLQEEGYTVLLDLTSEKDLLPPADRDFMASVGVDLEDWAVGWTEAAIKALEVGQVTGLVVMNSVVIPKGCTKVGVPHTVKDLMDGMSGEVPKELEEVIGGKEAVLYLKSLLINSGVQFQALGKPMTPSKILDRGVCPFLN